MPQVFEQSMFLFFTLVSWLARLKNASVHSMQEEGEGENGEKGTPDDFKDKLLPNHLQGEEEQEEEQMAAIARPSGLFVVL